MARTLPWAAKPASTTTLLSKPSRTNTPAATTPLKRKRLTVQEEELNTTGVSPRGHHQKPGSTIRTPSTSPPPGPPSEEPMRPSDDAWIMVEDELYAVAQMFTQHLHHAEYKRLQSLATRRNMDIAQITRPVDERATPSKETKLRKRQEEKRKQIDDAVGVVKKPENTSGSDEEEEEEVEDMVIGDRNLAGLMMGTSGGRYTGRALLKGEMRKSKTRAAAGFEKQKSAAAGDTGRLYDIPALKHEEGHLATNSSKDAALRTGDPKFSDSDVDTAQSEDDDDDLDGPVQRMEKRRSTTHSMATPSMSLVTHALPSPPHDNQSSVQGTHKAAGPNSLLSRAPLISGSTTSYSKPERNLIKATTHSFLKKSNPTLHGGLKPKESLASARPHSEPPTPDKKPFIPDVLPTRHVRPTTITRNKQPVVKVEPPSPSKPSKSRVDFPFDGLPQRRTQATDRTRIKKERKAVEIEEVPTFLF